MMIIRINRGRRVNLGRVRGGGPQAFGYLMSATGVGALGGWKPRTAPALRKETF